MHRLVHVVVLQCNRWKIILSLHVYGCNGMLMGIFLFFSMGQLVCISMCSKTCHEMQIQKGNKNGTPTNNPGQHSPASRHIRYILHHQTLLVFTHARTHARRPARTHARTHARMHAHTGELDDSFVLSTVLVNIIRLTPHLWTLTLL